MAIEIKQIGGFIPQTNIKITDTRANTLLSNIRIERKIGNDPFVTLIQTDSPNNTFSYQEVNEFGKQYVYKVSYDVYQKQTVTNTTTNKANYWKENFVLNGLAIDSAGVLYGTGTATAKAEYLNKLNVDGTTIINLTGWIGNGGTTGTAGGLKGNIWAIEDAKWDNIQFHLRAGTTSNANRTLYINKMLDTSKFYDKRYWYRGGKIDVNTGRLSQTIVTTGAKADIDLQVSFRKSGNAYTYGLQGLTSLSSTGGKATSFIIQLKNGAKLSPDFTVKVTTPPTYFYKLIDSFTTQQAVIIREEPNLDYGIIMNEKGEGFRFARYEGNGLHFVDKYETKSASQILDIQNNEFPLVYTNDNKKTPSTNFSILVSNLAYKNRMSNLVIKSNYIYIYVPKSWNYQIVNGFYAYETATEGRVGNSDDIYIYNFNGARQVLSGVTLPPKWCYELLASSEKSHTSLSENYKDYADLAVSPTGNEILGQKG